MGRTKSGPHAMTADVLLLKRKGMSERDIAAQLGLSKTTIHRILERGDQAHGVVSADVPANADDVLSEYRGLVATVDANPLTEGDDIAPNVLYLLEVEDTLRENGYGDFNHGKLRAMIARGELRQRGVIVDAPWRK